MRKEFGAWLVTIFVLAVPSAALAHGEEIQAREPIIAMWQFEPEIVIGLLTAAALYYAGARECAGNRWWRHLLFLSGLLALGAALLSPIEPLADHVFVIHQIEHMLLRTIGPMLLLLSQPQAVLMRGMPAWLRRRIVAPVVQSRGVQQVFGFLSHPLAATMLFVGVSWFWMIPGWHDIAILNEPIHYCWHVSLLVTGLFFFSTIFDSRPAPLGPRLGTRLIMFWCAAMGNIILGAFLTFKSVPLYYAYDVTGRMFALDAMTDEQVGGLTMWIPGCMMFAVSVILILHRWGNDEQRAVDRRRRIGTTKTHVAAHAANLQQSNRAVAIGLGFFVGLVLLVGITAAVLYESIITRPGVASKYGRPAIPIRKVETERTP